jgi:membrane associated rhomboid family serine protease
MNLAEGAASGNDCDLRSSHGDASIFIPFPIRVCDGREYGPIPVVNGLLVALIVLVFSVRWSQYFVVGPGTGLLSPLTYAFAHGNVAHLVGNMATLLVFRTSVNRRLGNGWYCLAYFGSAVMLGLFARLFAPGMLLGASGAIFAVIAVALILMPSALVDIVYFALFPMTLVIGLCLRPEHWVFWFIRWGAFPMRAWWGLFLAPFLEIWRLVWSGWNWTNLAHLLGLLCGVLIVLLLPPRISMGLRRSAFA